jgi:hypothetical protein
MRHQYTQWTAIAVAGLIVVACVIFTLAQH